MLSFRSKLQREEAKMSRSLPGGWLESGHGAVVVFVKDFRDPLERRKKLMLRPWASIKDVKDQLQVVFNVPSSAQKLFYQGRELKNAHNLQQCGIYQDNAVVDFVARRQQNLALAYTQDCGDDRSSNASSAGRNSGGKNVTSGSSSHPSAKSSLNLLPEQMPVVNIHPYGAQVLPVSLMKITHQALQGLALGLAPVLAMDGTGGTYFFKDPSHRNVGCFKPQDEEPFGPNNPRGLVGQLGQSGLRRGILSGEACERELAAYFLDKDHFAGVPATSLVEARHPVFNYTASSGALHFKMGSLQEFVRHDDVASDLAPNQFATHQVHKIVLLDMRLLNTDRNDANILVRKKRAAASGHVEYELTPIDHGYCLPQFLEIAWCDWCWYNWPQLHEPLSAADRDYVLSLSAQDETARLGDKIPLRRACRRNMLIANMVVHKGVQADLTLFHIARLMCREDLDAPSILETLCLEAFRQLQATKQRRELDALAASLAAETVPANAQASVPIAIPAPSPKAAFRNLRVSIDAPSARDSLSFVRSPVANGAHSPPGFWASYAPFSSDEEEWEDEEEAADALADGTARLAVAGGGDKPRLSLNWDHMASHALSDAVQSVENGHSNGHSHSHGVAGGSSSNSGALASNGSKFGGDHAAARSPTSSFMGGENDKDEFELLNDALDDDVADEKLFLNLLGRLLDEKIEAARRRQQDKQRLNEQQQAAERRGGTSSSNSSSSSRPPSSHRTPGSSSSSSSRSRD